MTDILNELKMKRYILILVGIYITMAIKGQHINVAAPSRVNVGENFRVAYTVSTQDVDDFRIFLCELVNALFQIDDFLHSRFLFFVCFYITRPIRPLFTAFVFGLSKKLAAKIETLQELAR